MSYIIEISKQRRMEISQSCTGVKNLVNSVSGI